MHRWFAILSVVAIAAVGALSALPVGAGVTPIQPNCVVELATGTTAQPGELFPALCTEVEVTKVVTGDPAPGTTFDVVVECQEPTRNGGPFENVEAANGILPEGLVGPFEETLTFGEEGGTQSLVVGGGSDCTVSEVAPPGCELVNINPEEFDVEFVVFVNGQAVAPEPGSVLAVTVTNDCPVAAAAPAAVEITPAFTG